MATEVILPVLGETVSESTIVEWFKQEGDPVKRGESVVQRRIGQGRP